MKKLQNRVFHKFNFTEVLSPQFNTIILISQVIELIIGISGLMYAINRRDLIGGNYEN